MNDKAIEKHQRNDLSTFLNQEKKSLESYAHNRIRGDMREFLTGVSLAVQANNELQKCLGTDEGKQSLFLALQTAASRGLSLNPEKGEACLIPYSGKISYQPMKNGIIREAMATGQIDFIVSEPIYENDKLKITKSFDGDDYQLDMDINARGEMIGVLAGCKLIAGRRYLKYWTIPEIEIHRDRYSKAYKFAVAEAAKGNKYKLDNSPWVKSFKGMALKTALINLLSNIPLSGDIKKLIDDDEMNCDIEIMGKPRGCTPIEAAEYIKPTEEKTLAKKDPI